MSDIQKAFEELSKRKIDRRTFLKQIAAAGFATPAVMSYLQDPELTGTGIHNRIGLGRVANADPKSDPLVFNAWSFKPEVVEQFQRTFEKQYSEAVQFEVIPGDYTTIMINKMIANAPLDCLYTKAQGTKMLEAGWIHDLSDLPNIEEIKKATLPAQWEAQTYKGTVFGLPYFNSMKCCLSYNAAKLKAIGLTAADLPKTWDETYDLCRRLKKDKAVQYPIVMLWAKNYDAMLDNFIGECLARGDQLWDKDFNATFSENTPVAKTLEAWQSIWKDGLVPPDCLAGTDTLEIFGSGENPFFCGQSYVVKDLNDPNKYSTAGQVMMVPFAGQAWGFLDYGLYSIAERPKEDKAKLESRKKWVTFMGYKDVNGQYLVGKEWVKQANLGTGYPEVYNDPEVVEAYKAWMPEYPKLRDIMTENQKHVTTPNGWHAVWFPEWAVPAVETIAKVINGDMQVTPAVQALRKKWDDLQKLYAKK